MKKEFFETIKIKSGINNEEMVLKSAKVLKY